MSFFHFINLCFDRVFKKMTIVGKWEIGHKRDTKYGELSALQRLVFEARVNLTGHISIQSIIHQGHHAYSIKSHGSFV